MQLDTPWTGPRVGEALVRAFRRMPGHAVMSRAGRFIASETDAEILPFSWPELYVADVRTRRMLMTWARCVATGESVRRAYEGFEWNRSTAERRRVAALAAIAAGLERERRVTPA